MTSDKRNAEVSNEDVPKDQSEENGKLFYTDRQDGHQIDHGKAGFSKDKETK